MRLEDDPSIAICACPFCLSDVGDRCRTDDWRGKRVRSHVARLVKAQAVLGKMRVDARFSRKKQLAAADGFDKLQLEILKRRRVMAKAKKASQPGDAICVQYWASIAGQRYEVLHGTEVYTAGGRCMVASCDGGHLDRVQSLEMAQRIARLLTADEVEQAHVRHARRTGKTLTKITGVEPAGDDGFDAAWRASGRVYGDDALENVKLGWKMRGEHLSARDLQPSEDYVLAVEELKRQIRRVEKILRNASSTKMIDELWRCAERLKSAMAAFAKVDPNADRAPRPAADGAGS